MRFASRRRSSLSVLTERPGGHKIDPSQRQEIDI